MRNWPSQGDKRSKVLTLQIIGTPARGPAVSIPDITASLRQLGSSDSISMTSQHDGAAGAAAAWKQQTVRYRDEVCCAIESIVSVNSEIRENFHMLGDQTAGLTDFKDYKFLFELTVNDLQLVGRIEEICRTEFTPISPPARIKVVDEITARLFEIQQKLQEAKSHLLNSITPPAPEPMKLRLRKHRPQVSHDYSGYFDENR